MNNDMGWKLELSYKQLPKPFYVFQKPTPVQKPSLVLFNDSLAVTLGLNPEAFSSEKGVQMLSGNTLPPNSEPIAQAYAGHQFGHFTMLGDGRAVLLGEQVTPDRKRFDIQLKGAGRTPYSRGGDGRAALGPMLREYVISEAMHALRIPTTRSLAVVTTGETVIRDEFLDGAILTRVASSHLRVGTFQFAAALRNKDHLRALADYAIERHYPHVKESENCYLAFFQEVAERQAVLIAKWQLVGFIHGVMNTDNMSISGETIDYGPCAFIDVYDPETVFSSIDIHGRYKYSNQPKIGAWNLARFAEALLPLIDDDQAKAVELAQTEISKFQEKVESYWFEGMRKKLGLLNEEDGDRALIDELLTLMEKYRADYTNTFRALTTGEETGEPFWRKGEVVDWKTRWLKRLRREEHSFEQIKALMKRHNPAIIPRNHRVEEALEAAVENRDMSVLKNLLRVLKDPFAYSEEQKSYATPPPPSPVPYVTYCGT